MCGDMGKAVLRALTGALLCTLVSDAAYLEVSGFFYLYIFYINMYVIFLIGKHIFFLIFAIFYTAIGVQELFVKLGIMIIIKQYNN